MRLAIASLLFIFFPALSQAQPVPLIGYLAVASQQGSGHYYESFLQGLKDLGLKEGTHFRIEARWANSNPALLDALAKEIVDRKPAVIVAAPGLAVLAAHTKSGQIPIVQANGGDPRELGVAKSLAKPGGNVTGVTNIIGDISEKNLELLMTAVPTLKKIGFLIEPIPHNQSSLAGAQRSIKRYKVEVVVAQAKSAAELDGALSSLAKQGAQALVILSGSFFPSERKRIMAAAATHRWPVIGGLKEYADEGALLAYGANRTALYRRAAYYVDRILKGAQPGELPFEQPSTFELIVNAKTAKALGIRLPKELMLRANEVIE